MNDALFTDADIEALALDAAKLEALGHPAKDLLHLFSQSRNGKAEQCACGHMLEHFIHDVDLRPYGIEF